MAPTKFCFANVLCNGYRFEAERQAVDRMVKQNCNKNNIVIFMSVAIFGSYRAGVEHN